LLETATEPLAVQVPKRDDQAIPDSDVPKLEVVVREKVSDTAMLNHCLHSPAIFT
jgi:hypothetical protein